MNNIEVMLESAETYIPFKCAINIRKFLNIALIYVM